LARVGRWGGTSGCAALQPSGWPVGSSGAHELRCSEARFSGAQVLMSSGAQRSGAGCLDTWSSLAVPPCGPLAGQLGAQELTCSGAQRSGAGCLDTCTGLAGPPCSHRAQEDKISRLTVQITLESPCSTRSRGRISRLTRYNWGGSEGLAGRGPPRVRDSADGISRLSLCRALWSLLAAPGPEDEFSRPTLDSEDEISRLSTLCCSLWSLLATPGS
jgi:hypothetical protein